MKPFLLQRLSVFPLSGAEFSFPVSWSNRSALVEAWVDWEPLLLLLPHPCLGWAFPQNGTWFGNHCSVRVERASGVLVWPPWCFVHGQCSINVYHRNVGLKGGTAAYGHLQAEFPRAAWQANEGQKVPLAFEPERRKCSPSGRYRWRWIVPQVESQKEPSREPWQRLGDSAKPRCLPKGNFVLCFVSFVCLFVCFR